MRNVFRDVAYSRNGRIAAAPKGLIALLLRSSVTIYLPIRPPLRLLNYYYYFVYVLREIMGFLPCLFPQIYR